MKLRHLTQAAIGIFAGTAAAAAEAGFTYLADNEGTSANTKSFANTAIETIGDLQAATPLVIRLAGRWSRYQARKMALAGPPRERVRVSVPDANNGVWDSRNSPPTSNQEEETNEEENPAGTQETTGSAPQLTQTSRGVPVLRSQPRKQRSDKKKTARAASESKPRGAKG